MHAMVNNLYLHIGKQELFGMESMSVSARLAWWPRPFKFWPLKIGSRVTRMKSFRKDNFELPRPLRSRVRSSHATDRRTDRQTPPSFYNVPSSGDRGNNKDHLLTYLLTYWYSRLTMVVEMHAMYVYTGYKWYIRWSWSVDLLKVVLRGR